MRSSAISKVLRPKAGDTVSASFARLGRVSGDLLPGDEVLERGVVGGYEAVEAECVPE